MSLWVPDWDTSSQSKESFISNTTSCPVFHIFLLASCSALLTRTNNQEHNWVWVNERGRQKGFLLTLETLTKKVDWTELKAVTLLTAIPQNLIESLFSCCPGHFYDPSHAHSLVHLFCMSFKHAPTFAHEIPHFKSTNWLTLSHSIVSLCKTYIYWKHWQKATH